MIMEWSVIPVDRRKKSLRKQSRPSPGWRVPILLALLGGGGIVVLAVISRDFSRLPVQLGAWFTGIFTGWAIVLWLWRRRG
ncbi:hypothetical protein [Desulfofundulus thermobenzoicus]|nr:hypothetical protein [Desulfofundulus thermobenzoicus]